MRVDVVVIGGGPAGCAAAIRLLQSGMRVRLYEKAHSPRPKLCGGYLSAEAIPELADLGVLDTVKRSGGWPVHRVIVSAPSGAKAISTLTNPAFSVSRYWFDKLLLDRARQEGVEVIEGEDGLEHQGESLWTIMATGRALTPSRRGDRAKFWVRANSFYGVRALFENVTGITDQIELDTMPSGYFGLVRQDKGVNLCGLVDQPTLRRAGADLDKAMRQWARENPVLCERMKDARRVSAWQAVGPVQIGLRQLTEGQTFFAGDAACVVDPFAGEGMAIGLTTGRILKEAFKESPDDPQGSYERLWHKQFDRSRWLQAAICWKVMEPWWQELLVRSCQAFPALLRWLTDGTRPHAVIPAEAGIQDSLGLDPGFRRGDNVL